CGLVYRQLRILFLVGGVLGVASVVLTAIVGIDWPVFASVGDGLLGRGGEAFTEYSGAESGFVILAGTIGWAGLGYFLAAFLGCMAWLIWRAKHTGSGSRGQTILWIVMTVLSMAALLGPGGLSIPSVTLLVAFSFGLLPEVAGLKARRRSGGIFFVVMVLLMLQVGLVRHMGLAQWCVEVFGIGDKLLHGTVGFFLALGLVWILDARMGWTGGIFGCLLAAIGGGAGELLQKILTKRTADMADWGAHALGAAVALLLYLLYVASRWCELPGGHKDANCSPGVSVKPDEPIAR
ncbi:MAG: hypothetical protein KAU28_01085, partial [Phycisphaerae bacterium]|nr:hypothetical protein [Phycisphaerae bacterium]